MSDGKPIEPPDDFAKRARSRERTVYVLWGVGLGLLVVLGLFCWVVVLPVMQVWREVYNVWLVAIRQSVQDESEVRTTCKASVAELGGPDKALAKIRLYLRLPEWAAPGKHLAAFLLGHCGQPATATLIACLNGEHYRHPTGHEIAAYALGEIGPPAADAISTLVWYEVHWASIVRAEDFAAPLRKIDPDGCRVTAELAKFQADSDPKVRAAAADALKRLDDKDRP